MPDFPIVLVQWLDAVGGDTWKTIDSLKDMHPQKVTTIGFLVQETKHKLIIAASISGEDCGEYICIPKPWVKRVIRA